MQGTYEVPQAFFEAAMQQRCGQSLRTAAQVSPLLPLGGEEAACILDCLTYEACAQKAAQDGCTPKILSMVSLPGHLSIERAHGSPDFTLIHQALRIRFHGAL